MSIFVNIYIYTRAHADMIFDVYALSIYVEIIGSKHQHLYIVEIALIYKRM